MDWKVSFVVISILGFFIGGINNLYGFGYIEKMKDSFKNPDWLDVLYWFGFFCKYIFEPFVFFVMIIFIIIPKVK